MSHGTRTTSSALARSRRPDRSVAVRVYEDEIHPLWSARFEDLRLQAAGALLSGSVLELGCGAGTTTVELVRRLERSHDGRVVALEASPALLDRARERVTDLPKRGRIFFRQHLIDAPLPFAEETFDLVLADLHTVRHTPELEARLADLARVTRPGGRLIVSTALAGTWQEPLDLYRDVLERLGRDEAAAALETERTGLPTSKDVVRVFKTAGLEEVDVTMSRWELLFSSGREFFYAPVIEEGPLRRWKEIAGRGAEMQEVFMALKNDIDAYYAGRSFAVSVVAGCFESRKPGSPTP